MSVIDAAAAKIGVNPTRLRMALAIGAGVGSVGIPVGSAIMYSSARRQLTDAMAKKEKFPVTTPKDLAVITSIEKATKHFEKQYPDISDAQREAAIAELATAMALRNNAFYSMPTKAAKRDVMPAVFVSKGINPKVLAHEVGHHADAKILKAKSSEEFHKHFHPILSQLYGLMLLSKKSPTYKRELAAWEQSGVEAGDPIREGALKTYSRAGNALGVTGLSLALYLLSKRLGSEALGMRTIKA